MKRANKTIFILLYVFSLTTAHAQKVWTLQECIDYAIEHNIDVQQRAVAIKSQEVSLNSAKNAWLPTLSGSIGGVLLLENASGASIGTSTALTDQGVGTTFRINAEMPVFDGFKIPNQKKRERFALEAASYGLEAARKDVGIQVATYYLQCLYYKSMVDIARQQVEVSRQLVEKSKSLVEDGKKPRSEQANAEAQYAADMHSLADAEGQETLQLLTLTQLLNLPSMDGFNVSDKIDTPKDLLVAPQLTYDNIVSSWPAIQQNLALIEQSKKDVEIARGDYYPTVTFNASIGTLWGNLFHTTIEPSGFFRMLDNYRGELFMLNVKVPIFDHFTTRNKIRTAKHNLEKQQIELENNKLKLRKDIQTAYYNATVAKKKQESADKACEANTLSAAYEMDSYTEGYSTIFDLIQAQQKQLKAKQDSVQAKYEYLIRMKILEFYTK